MLRGAIGAQRTNSYNGQTGEWTKSSEEVVSRLKK